MPGKYRSVSTAEKRAQLEAAGEEWPIGSDGLPKVWQSNSYAKSGGGWRLRSAHRNASRKSMEAYRNTEEGRDASRQASQRYYRTNRGQETYRTYRDSQHYKDWRREYERQPHVRLAAQLRDMTRIRVRC